MFKFLGSAALIALLLCTPSCIFRPEYKRPYVDVPEDWRVKTDSSSTIANLRWWEQFNDPVFNELIRTALENNYNLKIAVARIEEYYGRLGVVDAALWPEVDGNASAMRNEVSLTTVPPTTSQYRLFNQFNALLNLSYQIDIWGKIHSASDAALADLLATAEAERAVVLTLVSSVASAYIQLKQYDLQLQISNQTYRSRVESMQLAEIRYKEGLTSEIEVAQADSEMQSAMIQIKELEISIPKTENQLCVLLGINPQPIPRGTTLDKLNMPPRVPSGIPSDLLENRPDILQAEQELSAAVSRVGVAKAAMFPQITLTGAYGNESAELHQLMRAPSLAWEYAISILTPVFDAGRLAYAYDISKAVMYEALYNYFNVVLNAFAEVDTALIAHQKTLELVVVTAKEVDALALYLKLAIIQYDNGLVDYLNVLDAERSLFQAQLSLAAARAASFTTLVQLYAALGGGWVVDADLRLPSGGNFFENCGDYNGAD